jgi:hypothetical protein
MEGFSLVALDGVDGEHLMYHQRVAAVRNDHVLIGQQLGEALARGHDNVLRYT